LFDQKTFSIQANAFINYLEQGTERNQNDRALTKRSSAFGSLVPQGAATGNNRAGIKMLGGVMKNFKKMLVKVRQQGKR
jgi:hypothetical protein